MKQGIKKLMCFLVIFAMILTLAPAGHVSAANGTDKGTPTGAPAVPAFTHDNWSGEADYNLAFNIWWGNNATSYKLYENNTVILEGTLEANSPNAQTAAFPVTGKAKGSYTYKLELTNSFGTTKSNDITVTVTKDAGVPEEEQVKAPSFSLADGAYASVQSLEITTATAGASIFYTTNGTQPSKTSTEYKGAVSIGQSMTVKAIAVKDGMKDSDVVTGEYTIRVDENVVEAPVFSVKGGTFNTEQNIVITCATADAEIHYTTNGTEPVISSPVYTSAVKITESTTLKAKAWKDGLTESAVTTASYVIKNGEEPDVPNSSIPKHALIGYWHTWGGDASGGVPFVKLGDVDPNWDVINISFAEPVSAGSTDGRMKLDMRGLSAAYTKDDFKADVKALQAQDKKIVLSIGGYEGYFSLTSDTAVKQFVSDIRSIVDEYGFDGIDIDLEQSSVTLNSGNDPDYKNPVSPKVVNMITAIRQICDAYGDDFILSWAPETFYVQLGYQFYAGLNSGCDSRAGVYLPMIHALRDKTTYVHVQLYNSMPIMGSDGKQYSMGSAEAVEAMCKMLLEGFNVGGKSEYFFQPLRADQVVIGVPSSSGAAGSGHITNENLQKAFNNLVAVYPNLRGIMTWSINWDVFQNNNSFAQSNGQFLHAKN